MASPPCTLMTTVPYALIHTRVLPAHRKSPGAGSRVFVNRSISFATWHVVPESSMKDRLSGYLEFLVIKVEPIITRLIDPISLPYSQSSDVGSIAGVADCDFLIADVLARGLFADRTSSCKSVRRTADPVLDLPCDMFSRLPFFWCHVRKGVPASAERVEAVARFAPL
jgi:hypothetical protein